MGPKRNSKHLEVKEKKDSSEPAPYFLPPSPVFTGNSCDGYNNLNIDYTEPYSSNTTPKNCGNNAFENDKPIENDEVNEPISFNSENNINYTAIANDKLQISNQSSLQSKVVAEPKKGHALLCQLVQNPI